MEASTRVLMSSFWKLEYSVWLSVPSVVVKRDTHVGRLPALGGSCSRASYSRILFLDESLVGHLLDRPCHFPKSKELSLSTGEPASLELAIFEKPILPCSSSKKPLHMQWHFVVLHESVEFGPLWSFRVRTKVLVADGP